MPSPEVDTGRTFPRPHIVTPMSGGIILSYETYLSRRLAPTSVKLRLHWVRKLADYHDPLTATEDTLLDFLDTGPQWKPATILTAVASMKSFYGWAHKHGHTPTNPTVDLPPVRVPRIKSRIASEDQIRDSLIGATPSTEAMIRLGAEGGLRVAEISSLHVDDRDGEWLTVTGKGGKVRSVYLSPELAGILTTLERTSAKWGYYFPGRPRRPVAPSTVWRRIRRTVGVNTHSLRHRAGTAVYRGSGFDLRLAQEFLGHSSPTTTALYLHVERDQLIIAAAATRLAA